MCVKEEKVILEHWDLLVSKVFKDVDTLYAKLPLAIIVDDFHCLYYLDWKLGS